MADQTTVVAAAVPAEVAEDLRQLAARRERSIAAEVRLALRAWLVSEAEKDAA